MSYYSCPLCDAYFFRNENLQSHLIEKHPQYRTPEGQGWWEPKTEKPDGSNKALLHEIAQTKALLKNTERTPIQANIPIAPPQKQPIQLQPNWHNGMDGSLIYEQKVGEHNTPLSSYVQILKAKIHGNHFLLTSYIYTKDLREIALCEEKRNVLESRLQGLTISDYAFVEVAKAIQETDRKLKDLRNGLNADSEISHIIEDYYHGEIGTGDYDNWRKKCMEMANTELARLSKNFTSQIENPVRQ